jgi:hypothetical protein
MPYSPAERPEWWKEDISAVEGNVGGENNEASGERYMEYTLLV